MQKRPIVIGLILLFLVFGFTGPLPQISARFTPALDIAVSIESLAGIIHEVGGDLISITVLLPEGIEPHAFSLTQSVIDSANAADLLVLTGHFLWEEELANQTGKPYLTLDDYEFFGAELLPLAGYNSELDRQHNHNVNLHGYWLLPQNAIAIANATYSMLVSLNSTHADYWSSRFGEFCLDINELTRFIDELSQIHLYSTKKVVVTFPAEMYIAATLGLEVAALLMEGENIFISGPELIAVEQALQNGSIALILASDIAQLQAAGEFAQQLSTDSGVPVVWVRVVFSALKNYIGLMSYNVGVVATGLGGGISPASDFLTISMPIIIIAVVLGVIAVIELVLLFRCTRIRD